MTVRLRQDWSKPKEWSRLLRSYLPAMAPNMDWTLVALSALAWGLALRSALDQALGACWDGWVLVVKG